MGQLAWSVIDKAEGRGGEGREILVMVITSLQCAK